MQETHCLYLTCFHSVQSIVYSIVLILLSALSFFHAGSLSFWSSVYLRFMFVTMQKWMLVEPLWERRERERDEELKIKVTRKSFGRVSVWRWWAPFSQSWTPGGSSGRRHGTAFNLACCEPNLCTPCRRVLEIYMKPPDWHRFSPPWT